MLTLRLAAQRGHFDHGWLDTSHTFSFGDYHDPQHMGFRALRVINEDRVQPGRGFGTHGHRDMEILTWVLEGALKHKDSMGNGSVIRPGDVQRMSAGTGVTHSEENASKDEPVHFLQIWLVPGEKGLQPGYEQKAFPAAQRSGLLQLLASRDGREGSVTVHADASVYGAALGPGERAELMLPRGRHAWVHLARGAAKVNGVALGAGDGVAVSEEPRLALEGTTGGDVLLFDLA